jgi:hypothetical protein
MEEGGGDALYVLGQLFHYSQLRMGGQNRHAAINISRSSKNVVCDYNLYWHKDSPKMGMLGFRQTREGEPIPHGAQDAKTIEDMRRMFGFEHQGLFGDPLFVDLEKGDYRLDEGSLAVGMSMEGEMVGMRNSPHGLR